MSEQHLLPPILATPDLRLVSVEAGKDGAVSMRFATVGRSSNPIREVVVFIKTTILSYEYSIYDGTLRLINHYRGEHGDPEHDEWIGSYGLQQKPPA